MCSGALKQDAIELDFVNQQPIGFNVSFPASCPVADQFMIPTERIKRFFRDQGTNDDFQLIKILPSFFYPLNIFLELPCIFWLGHQIPSFLNIPSATSQTVKPCPASVSSSVRSVISLWMATSKGNPFLNSTWV